jgi:hypothetical protein
LTCDLLNVKQGANQTAGTFNAAGGNVLQISGINITFHIIPNYSHQDATFLDLFIFTDALHVSGGSSLHHQEHTTVQTASGIVNQYCY